MKEKNHRNNKLYYAKPENRAKRQAKGRAWYYEKGGLERARRHQYKKKYGITLEQFEAMLAAQDNRCAICRSTEPKGQGSFHVDHDHATGKIRGLLCHHCNYSLGGFKDSTDLLLRAVDYLKGASN